MSRLMPLLLCAVGGLVVVIATAAAWVTREEVRSVGGVEVGEAVSTSGTEIAPVLLVLGLTAIAAGVVLALMPVAVRRVLALPVVGLGVATTVTALVRGFTQLDLADGARTPAAAFAAIGGLIVAGGGYVATRARSPGPASTKYDVDAASRHDDTEWDLAVDDDRA